MAGTQHHHKRCLHGTALSLMFVLLIERVRAQLPVPRPLMPAMFVLGDSLVDPGNNNYILTIAKSNFPPNGEDFPQGATGRFCNGRTVADVIAQLMNLPFLPAYLDPRTQGVNILMGINYASAAGGILDGTGANYIGRISLNQQIAYLKKTKQQFEFLLGPSSADDTFSKSFFYLVIGSNDYINNYLLQDSPTRKQFTPPQYQDHLIQAFRAQLIELYNMGARKFGIFNVGPLGCIPSQLALQKSPDGSCIKFVNDYVVGFNSAVQQLSLELTDALPGTIFVYADSYSLVYEKILNPAAYGLTVVNRGCCGVGMYNGQLPCLPFLKACSNRNEHLFWDPFHPTDAVNEMLGQKFFSGPPSVISPINIQQLAAM